MIALFFGQSDRTPDVSAPDKNVLLRIIDAAAEARMRKFHRATEMVAAAADDASDHDQVCAH